MFQGSSFATTSTSSPFGQTAFGKPATTGFSTPVFGSAPSNTLFGGGTTQQPSLFGSTTSTPAFGQAQTTQPAFGGFTSTSTGSTGLFGAPQNASTSGGLFGATTTSAFGQSKPAFGGFGLQQQQPQQPAGGMFGQQSQPQMSLFGQTSTQPTSGLFGGTGTSAFGTSTAVGVGGTGITKFTPVSSVDTMVKNGATTSINTRHHCISCMKEYDNKSLEELRLEDYLANRKGPQQGAQSSTGLFSGNQQTSLFGTNTNTAAGFGTGTSTNLFGATTPGSSLFNKPTATASPFGSTATTSTSSFGGFSTGTTPSMFGSNNLSLNKPLNFGTSQTPGTGLFGSTTQTTPAFGTQTSFGSSFGAQPAQNNGLFANKSAFAPSSTTGFSFSQPTSTTTNSVFGQKPATTGFSTGFGAPSTTTSFGTPFTSNFQSGFGSNFKTNTSFNFNSTQPSNTLGANLGSTGTSIFNSASKPLGLFNSNNTQSPFGGSLGGAGTTFNTGSNSLGLGLGGGLGSMGGGFGSATGGNLTAQNIQNPINQHIATYAALPFGDSRLFKNILTSDAKNDDVIKPTSPATQKAILSGQNFKISPKNPTRIKVKPIESSTITKKSLFDDLDHDEDVTNDILNTVRPSPKRLVLKPALNVDSTVSPRSILPLHGVSNLINEMSPTIKSSSKIAYRITRNAFDTTDFQNSIPGSSTPHPAKKDAEHRELTASEETSQPGQNKSNENVQSASSSSDSDFEDSIPPKLDSTLTEHSAGIVLKRVGYYTIPSMDELAGLVDENGRCFVDNFTVGRLNYGNIFFPQAMDVAGLNIDDIVHFRHKEVVVYPNDDNKPPVGEGLNRKAQVTLDRVWPVDKTTRQPITDPDKIATLDFESKLARACAKDNTKFVEYRPTTGSWVFKVEHFSKYGLSDSDDEDTAPAVDIKKMKLNPLDLARKPATLDPVLFQTEQTNGSLAQGAVLLCDEDEDMDDGITSPFDFDDEIEKKLSPTSRLAKETGTSSRKLQVMKASFFRQGLSMEDDFLENDYADMDNHASFRVGGFNVDAKKILNWCQENEFALMDDETCDVVNPSEFEPEPMFVKERSPSPKLEVPEKLFGKLTPRSFVLKFRQQLIPLTDSVTKNGSCLVEKATFAGRGFRVGWTPKGLTLLNSRFFNDSNLFDVCEGRPADNLTFPAVEVHSLYGSSGSEDVTFEETVLKHLEAVYHETIISSVKDCPLALPKKGSSGLRRHCKTSLRLSSAFKEHRHIQIASEVWSLCGALWDDLGVDPPDSHAYAVQKKQAVSEWLEAVLSEPVTREAKRLEGPAAVFSYLTGRKIDEACEIAQQIGDTLQSLMISQCQSSDEVKSLIQKQLVQWRDTQADLHIDINRMKSAMLLAGIPVHKASNSVINSCSDIGWLRAFALHLWYVTPYTSTVTDALLSYEKSFMSGWDENYASPPVPFYSDQYTISTGGNKPLYDILYHVLKLYSFKSYPMEQLLNPATYTPDLLDYRLSWFVMRVLNELGYSHLSEFSAAVIHTSFASQLEAQGLWEWAVFVLMHLANIDERKALIKGVIGRNITSKAECDKEQFLIKKLSIPESWIYEAKAVRCSFNKKYEDVARYLIKAGKWNDCHDVVMKHLSSKYIANENYEFLEKLLKELAQESRAKEIVGWTTGGAVVLKYLELIQEVKHIVAARDPSIGYHLERLQPHMKELCQKIKLMKTSSPMDKLSQAEMAKRTADLIQNLIITHCEDRSPMGVNVLCHLINDLPLTKDFASLEWMSITSSWGQSTSV